MGWTLYILLRFVGSYTGISRLAFGARHGPLENEIKSVREIV